jgi:hypothetical protein
MVKVCRYQRGNQNPYIEEEQTTQWSRYTDSDYFFGIFKLWPLCCLFFLDIRILIIPLVSSSFGHCTGNQNLYIEEEQTIQWPKFDDTKGVIIIRTLKKNRQHNSQKKKYKRTSNDLQNIHIKLKDVDQKGHRQYNDEKENGQRVIYKTLHRKLLKIAQHELH